MHGRVKVERMPLDVRHMRHVIDLTEHGSRLFVRTPSGVGPTDGGRVFVARIRQSVDLTEDLDRDLASERGLQGGHLNVGGGPFPAQSVLADAPARFVADFPRIVVRVMMRDWDELLRRLRARDRVLRRGDQRVRQRERPGNRAVGTTPDVPPRPPRSLEPIRAAQRRLPDAAAANRVLPALEFNSLDAVRKIVLGCIDGGTTILRGGRTGKRAADARVNP